MREPHLLALVLANGGQSRVGITASKKVGNAVVRNKVKRIFREIIRHEYPTLCAGWDIVLIVHPNAATTSHEQLRHSIQRIFQRLASWT